MVPEGQESASCMGVFFQYNGGQSWLPIWCLLKRENPLLRAVKWCLHKDQLHSFIPPVLQVLRWTLTMPKAQSVQRECLICPKKMIRGMPGQLTEVCWTGFQLVVGNSSPWPLWETQAPSTFGSAIPKTLDLQACRRAWQGHRWLPWH
jgi:hypothetical protein